MIKRKKQSKTSWTIENEIRFVKRIGTWGFSNTRKSEFPRLTLLENYLKSSIKRETFGKDFDKERLIKFISDEIEKEKKPILTTKLPAAKTKCKRKK
jgi:hypothetical protein